MNKLFNFKVVAGIMLALFIIQNASSQDVEFTYDASGNRITQGVIYLKSSENDEQDSTYNDHHPAKPILTQIGDISFRVLPNPTSGRLIVTSDGDAIGHIFKMSVSTSGGVLIWNSDVLKQEQEIDMSAYGNGVYILNIHIDNEDISWKIIKQ